MTVMHSATTTSDLWSELDELKQTLTNVSVERNISEVLMLTILRDFCDRRLTTVIEEGR